MRRVSFGSGASLIAALLVSLLACGNSSSPKAGPVAGGLARVDSIVIGEDEARYVARARDVDVRTAVGLLVDDAVVASAVDRESPAVRGRVRAAKARWFLREVRAVADAPLTDAETLEAADNHWAEVDHPELREVVHAIVLRSKQGDPAKARARGEEMRDALVKAPDADFDAVAKTFGRDGLEVKVETLVPFASTGRAIDGSGYEATFVAGAYAIAAVGGTSPLVESSFGWHVIRLRTIRPAVVPSLEERRVRIRPDLVTARGTKALAAFFAGIRPRVAVTVASDVDALLRSLPSETDLPEAQ